ncbi:MAG: hypothetical protein WC216_06805 [Gallionella sp.]|jgi:hypothetical protein
MNEKPSTTSQFRPILQVVSFTAAGHRFAVEAASVRAQHSATDDAIPAEELLGLPDACIADTITRRVLIIRHATGDLPIRVAGPVSLSELSLDDLHPLPDLLAARCKINGIRALSAGLDGITVLIDFCFLNQNEA